MNDLRLFSRCFRCKRVKFAVWKRKVPLPIGKLQATSRERFCTPCYTLIKSELAKGVLS